jgi:hypothetical protein
LNFSRNWSKAAERGVDRLAHVADRAPALFGPMISQNMVWFTWPPPLLRTAVRMFSGTMAQVVGQQLLERPLQQVRRGLQRLVQVVHIRGVVAGVMNLHGRASMCGSSAS